MVVDGNYISPRAQPAETFRTFRTFRTFDLRAPWGSARGTPTVATAACAERSFSWLATTPHELFEMTDELTNLGARQRQSLAARRCRIFDHRRSDESLILKTND
jgi:hypothetical protein